MRTKDLRAVLDLVYLLNSDSGDTSLAQVLAGLGRLVGADVTSYTRVDHRTDRLVSAAVEPAEQNMSGSAAFHEVFAQHPGLAAYRSGRLELGRSVALSELAPQTTLRRLPLYVDFYAARGTVDQLVCLATLDRRHGTTLAFNRGRRGFSDRDRAIADAVTPHLTQALDRRSRIAGLRAAAHRSNRLADELDAALAALPALSESERRVVERLTGGLTNREIAQGLAISPRTVHKHLENTYRKLGVTNRASLIALLHGSGR